MKLRREQLVDLREDRIEAFVRRMALHLSNDLPEHCEKRGLTKESLEPFVREGMADAEAYGITSEPGVRQYLDCMIVLGLDFDETEEHAWAGDILRRDDLGPAEKAQALSWGMLTKIQWEDSDHG